MPPIAHATVTTLAAFPATTVVPYSPVPDLYLQCWLSAWRAQHGCTTTSTM